MENEDIIAKIEEIRRELLEFYPDRIMVQIE